jgi:hypothetical protein
MHRYSDRSFKGEIFTKHGRVCQTASIICAEIKRSSVEENRWKCSIVLSLKKAKMKGKKTRQDMVLVFLTCTKS